MKKTSLVFITIFTILFILSCGNRNQYDKNIRIFRYNESSGISSLDPAFAKNQSNIWASSQIFNGLLQLNEDLEIKECIAKSYQILDSGRVYEFILRDDVYFHQDELFTKKRRVVASDFVYSLNRLVDEKTASPGAWVMSQVQRNDDNNLNIIALNDTILKIKLKNPFPAFASLLCMTYCSVVPKEVVEHYGKDFRSNPVGTGPFYFKMWKEGVKLVLLKNQEYFEKDEKGNPIPYLDAINISFIIDKQTEFLEFISGNLDFISGLNVNYKDELLTPYGTLNPKYKKEITLIKEAFLNTEYLGFMLDSSKQKNADNPLMIKEVRQAINYGFDRQKMMRYLRNDIGMPGEMGFIPYGLSPFDTSKYYTYQPEKALELLAQAGYPNAKGLGTITLTTTSEYLDICKFIQQQLGELGMDIKIEVNPPATLREMVANSNVAFFRASWIADYPDAENYLSLFYSKNFSPQGPNYTHFNNPIYDDLYEKSIAEPNDSIRKIYYTQMNEIVMEEAAVVVLYYDQVMRFVQKNTTGLNSNPMNMLILKKVKKT
jgi:peptide/nickel transport system substrate-binding protein